MAVFEPRLFVGAVLPFLIGFALGNGIDLHVIAKSGIPGIFLGLAVIVVTGIPLILAGRFIGGGNGTTGIAASSPAGAAVANPAIIGEMVPRLKPLVPAATATVATACLITAILVPIATAIWARRFARPVEAGEAAAGDAGLHQVGVSAHQQGHI